LAQFAICFPGFAEGALVKEKVPRFVRDLDPLQGEEMIEGSGPLLPPTGHAIALRAVEALQGFSGFDQGVPVVRWLYAFGLQDVTPVPEPRHRAGYGHHGIAITGKRVSAKLKHP
jgi:hypothetical protein